MAKQDRMFAMIATWQRSGMSKAAFARQSRVSINAFHYWRHRFEERSDALVLMLERIDRKPTRGRPGYTHAPSLNQDAACYRTIVRVECDETIQHWEDSRVPRV